MFRRSFGSLRNLPKKVKIVEVGARDGLQNEKKPISVEVKVELVKRLLGTGLTYAEAGSFVSPKWVPQMANTDKVFEQLNQMNYPSSITLCGLTPNLKGLEGALASQVKEVAVFAAASEAFSKKNINSTIEESLKNQKAVTEQALAAGLTVRGYVSCALGCPYEGEIDPQKVLHVTQRLLEFGCYEVSIGDTIGSGNPLSTDRLLTLLHDNNIPMNRLAAHFHDTRGLALPNLLVALEHGISVIDSSVSGLGGCPYAAGATGNVATEDVVYMLHSMGIETGVNLQKLIEVGEFIDQHLERKSGSKVAIAFANKKCKL